MRFDWQRIGQHLVDHIRKLELARPRRRGRAAAPSSSRPSIVARPAAGK
jgi:hypothetical protein